MSVPSRSARPRSDGPVGRSEPDESLIRPVAMPDGKRRLLDAAVELGGTGRGISSLGIRELARHAGLNPNSFYRHFDTIEDVGRAVATEVAEWILERVRVLRARAAGRPDDVRLIVEFFYDAVLGHPEPFVIGLHELYGSSPAMRDIIRDALRLVAVESAAQRRELGADGGLPSDVLLEVTSVLTDVMFHEARTLLDHPDRRDEVVERTMRFTAVLFAGAIAVHGTA